MFFFYLSLPTTSEVCGESAGAISTMLLTVAPAAKNLFQKAISQSATSVMVNSTVFVATCPNVYGIERRKASKRPYEENFRRTCQALLTS